MHLYFAQSILQTIARVLFAWNAVADDLPQSQPLDFVFTSQLDGSEQRYVVVHPPAFDDDMYHDIVIALHGHGSDRWQFVTNDRPECLATRTSAAQNNMILVSPDYRATTSWMGPAADSDLLQILDELHGTYRIRHVIVAGGSMGATSALAFAAMHPDRVDGVVAMNGTANLIEYPNFSEAIAASYGGSRADVPDVYRVRSAELFPERLTMPLAVTTGGNDTLVPPESTLRLAASLKQRGAPVLSIHRPQGGHDTNYEDAAAAAKFVIDHLAAAANRQRDMPRIDSAITPFRIVCLGDSVTGVYYHTGGQRAYPEMLELALQSQQPDAAIRVINAGISGHTTADGLARLETDVLHHRPNVVTISFGLNDVTRVPADQFRTNLELLIDRCTTQKCQVVLCTPNAVIETSDRPIARIDEYSDIIRSVGREKSVPVCDQYRAGQRLMQRAPQTWRLTMSDAIHPNMDGHKRMAEELCRTLTGSTKSLQSIGPPRPILSNTLRKLSASQPLKIVTTDTLQEIIPTAILQLKAAAAIELTSLNTVGKSLPQLRQEVNSQVRARKPDLVVLTIPADTTVENEEQLIDSVSWILNGSLSFGRQEWDCVVVDPAVLNPAAATASHSNMIRRLVAAQHLELIDRNADDISSAEEIIARWFNGQRAP